jgi:DNA-3-methyladenine glycosylase II
LKKEWNLVWQESVTVKAPYRFSTVLERLSKDPLNHIDLKNKIIRVPVYINVEKEVVTVEEVETDIEPTFLVSGETNKKEALKRIATIFQWDVSLKEVLRHFEHTNLSSLVQEHAGTPLILDFSPYLSLMKCIIHQQLNMSFAYTLTKRLVETYGEEKEGILFYPLPEKVASLSYEDLKELQFSQRKAEYLIDTSRLIVNGELSLEELEKMKDEEIYEKLIKIRGIGAWTIQNLLLFGYGRQNLFPKADIGIQNAIKRYFELDKKPTNEQMDYLSKGWDPFLSYASLYLWRSIEKKQ